MEPIPILETVPNLLPLLRAANAIEDDERVRTWIRKKDTVLEDERAKLRTYNTAARVADYPRDELVLLKGQLERARGARKALAVTMDTEVTRSVDRDSLRAHETVATYLGRPEGVDPVGDTLELQAERTRLAEMDAAKRAVVIRSAAEAGEHRLALRAALAPPRAGEERLLPESVEREARAWIVTKRAPEVIRNLRAAQRLRRIAAELAVAEYALALE